MQRWYEVHFLQKKLEIFSWSEQAEREVGSERAVPNGITCWVTGLLRYRWSWDWDALAGVAVADLGVASLVNNSS